MSRGSEKSIANSTKLSFNPTPNPSTMMAKNTAGINHDKNTHDMNNRIVTFGLLIVLAVSCSVHEMDQRDSFPPSDQVFFAQMEKPVSDAQTKVYVDDDLMVLWHADDRVSIFNKYTYNQEYRFTGQTGANAGSFQKVPNDDFVTGNALDLVYAIYPYQESTAITNQGVLSIDLPTTQTYAENSFGIGANTMISCSEGNELMFKNLCGYLMLKLYGDNVTVTSISLKGNNGEPLAGTATVNASVAAAPTLAFGSNASKEISVTFDTPVKLGTTAENATVIWIVIPPTTFSKGFTLTVKDNKNGLFEKATSKSFEIGRNKLARMAELIVEPDPSDDVIMFEDDKVKERLVAAFDSNGDGELSYIEAASVTSIDGVFGAIKTYNSFDEFRFFTGVTEIPALMFRDWTLLKSIIIPNSVTTIGYGAFSGCIRLKEIDIPDSVVTMNPYYSYQSGYDFGTFSGCTSLERVSLSKQLTTISPLLFLGCTSLVSIEVPQGVRSIGDSAFVGCSKLSSVFLPDGLETISDYAFVDCTSLEDLIIPNTVSVIGDGAFSRCTTLKKIVLPSSITSIGSIISNPTSGGVFENCSSLEEVVIPNGLSIIGSLAFCNCESLSSIDLPNSVTSIGCGAFSGCINLKKIVIPESVTMIQEPIGVGYKGLFEGCVSLGEIVLPNTISSIGTKFVYGCKSLSSISIPDSVSKIGCAAFYGCENLNKIIIPNSVTEIDYQYGIEWNSNQFVHWGAFENCIRLEEVVLSISLSAISAFAFYGCNNLVSINIPDSVTSIGAGAFYGCSSLKAIDIPDSVTKIESYYNREKGYMYGAFAYCTGLKTVSLSNSLSSLSSCTFFCCENLTSIVLPERVTSIGESAFSQCLSLKDVKLPSGLVTIGGAAFNGCRDLKRIIIPDSVTELQSIGRYPAFYGAFTGCTGLEEIVIPKSVTTIGISSFSDCSSLRTVSLSEGLLTIEALAFQRCSSLTSIQIPEGVTTIGGGAFERCSSLKSITIPNSVTTIQHSVGSGTYGAFYGCDELEEVVLSNSLMAISPYMFSDCANLKTITIPESITTIGEYAFRNCSSISALSIPQNISTISDYAFFGCSGLADLVLLEGISRIGYHAFEDCSGLHTVSVYRQTPPSCGRDAFRNTGNSPIYVPSESVEAYKNKQYWSDYADRIQALLGI